MNTVLVTGGNGFIGSYVVRNLLQQGEKVLVLDRRNSTVPEVESIYGDVRDEVHVTEAMAHATSWIHLAGVLGTQETVNNPRPAAYTNIIGGLNVLEAATQYKLPGVIITIGNYWEQNTYSITKYAMERFAAMYRKERGLPVTTVRALNAYGPGQVASAPYGPGKVRKIVPALVCRALDGVALEIYGDGQQVMDQIHVADVAEILVRSLIKTRVDGAFNDVIEAGTGRDTTVNDIASIIQKEVQEQANIMAPIKHLPMRPGETPGSVVLADTRNLAWVDIYPNQLVTLEDGLKETVTYYRNYLASR